MDRWQTVKSRLAICGWIWLFRSIETQYFLEHVKCILGIDRLSLRCRWCPLIVYGQEVIDFVCWVNGTEQSFHAVGIGWEKDGEIVGGIMYEHYFDSSIQVHMSAKPDVRVWGSKEFIFAGFHYPFEQLKVKKLIGYVSEANTRMCRLVEHLGFICEHTIEYGFRGQPLRIYTMTKEQCRFLGNAHETQIQELSQP